jgi:general secretion pathway protein D
VASPRVTESGEGDVTLDFVNADVTDVAKAVLGDTLKLNYVVGSTVQGTVTLQTSRPLPRDAVLPALEAAFRLSGLALIESGGTYRIVPVTEAPRQAGVTRNAVQPGYGVEIVPLRYVGAVEMSRMLEPLAPFGSVLRADAARNLLVIAGTSQERQALIDNIQLFDVDWMKGMSFAVFPLKSADAKAVAAELSQIIGIKDGPLAGVVKLTAIQRMNALLAISTQSGYLDTLQGWIDRLDRAQASSDQRLYVYYVQNARAKDLAGVLGKALGAEGSGDTGTSAPAQGPQLPAVPEQPLSQPLSPSGGPRSAAPSDDSGDTAGAAGTAATPAKAHLRITADEADNALLILATPSDYDLVASALAKQHLLLHAQPAGEQHDAAQLHADVVQQAAIGAGRRSPLQLYL